MSRNRQPEYLRKLVNAATNGYHFDLVNYLYNPDLTYNYPVFKRCIGTRDGREFYREVGYFKRFDGTGSYFAATFSRAQNGDSWQVVQDYSKVILASAPRFSLKTLLSYCT